MRGRKSRKADTPGSSIDLSSTTHYPAPAGDRYLAVLENASDAVMLVTDSRIIDCNASALRTFRTTREEIIGRHPWRFSPKRQPNGQNSREVTLRRISGAVGGETEPFEWLHLRLDGTVFDAEVRIHVARLDGEEPTVVIAGRDITVRKETELYLRKSEGRFRMLFNAAPDAYYLSDLKGTFLDGNDAAEQMVGYKRASLIGRGFLELGLLGGGQLARAAMLLARNAMGHPTGPDEFVLNRGTGDRVNVEISTRPITIEGRKVVLGLARDITERKQAKEEQEKLQAQLIQAQKMESVGRLAGGVAHDFNNMLGVILGHTELAMDQVEPSQPLSEDLQEIHNAAMRSADLTRQLLAFARKQTIAPRVLDLNEIIESMLKMLRRLIGEDINLAWLPGAGIWPVRVDPSQIDQILANLCVNARDAITGVGNVTIRTENSILDQAYCADHPGFNPGEYVLLVVSDDGCGMDEETLGRLFEPFFTTREGGTGLGLSTVYGIVKQNDGIISASSEPANGATFKIYLSRSAGKTGEVQKEGSAIPAARGHETILLVEDELAILKLAKAMLKRQGYTVLAASTPAEAIRLAGEHRGEIHLVMTDVIMPEMNGAELATELLSLYPNLKRLFMSGYTADIIANRGVIEEGVNFIQKPFAIQALATMVREALDND